MPMSSATGHPVGVTTSPGGARHSLNWYLPGWRTILRRASHACCCPGRPAIVVVMPPAPARREPVELLFCRHHYRVHSGALAAADGLAFDTHGAPASVETLLMLEAGR